MNILGIVTKSHDTGLAVLRDGVPELVLEEERFNREKHTLKFPVRSLETAFGREGYDLGDFQAITTPWCMAKLRPTVLKSLTAKLPHSLNLLRPNANWAQEKAIVNLPMRLYLGLGTRYGFKKVPKIIQVAHHDAHAAAFLVSPFDEAAVLVMDGYGDETATSAYVGRGPKLERLWCDGFFDSLGMLYTCMSEHLGFRLFEEGTVMALAAMGGPTYVEKFRDLVKLKPEGRIEINRSYISYDTHGFNKPFKKKFYDVFGPPRQRNGPMTDHDRDLAYALQHVTEEAVLHIVRELSRRHPSRNLVLSGGVALNCVANARILRDTDYRAVWVPPIASDSGVVLGSTLYHWHCTLGNERRHVMTHPFYGLDFNDDEIRQALDAAGLSYQRMDDAELLPHVAKRLADGKIVGWFQGRAEIGPRALGNRSILSDARSEKMKDHINARIKHREPFRPFAPAVLVEHMSEYFELDQPDPFMTMAPRVRPDKVPVIPAAVHVDGTGRIQTVERTANPRYYAVIEEYAKITGIPVLLNTSFNRQEPVVNSPEEAISCYLRTGMEALTLGNFYTEDRNAEAVERAVAKFAKLAKAA